MTCRICHWQRDNRSCALLDFPMRRIPFLLILLLAATAAHARPVPCSSGIVWEDSNANGLMETGEPPLAGVRLFDGERLVTTDAAGQFAFPAVDGRTVFLIKPASHALPIRADGSPDFWFNIQGQPGPTLKYGGIPKQLSSCRNFGLLPIARAVAGQPLQALIFADPQVKSLHDVGYYRGDIVAPLMGDHGANIGITLGDVVDDDLSLYPEILSTTVALGIPWLHIPGNHDLDLDAADDADSLRTYRRHFGPDTYAREEGQATFIALDNVIYCPGQNPAYIGGLRKDQFEFLQSYLPTVRKDRLLVLGMHIPLFNPLADVEAFRAGDRERLFALLQDFPHLLVLSGHSHTQRHWYHDESTGWRGATPLHEYNVGAASGAFWSGVKDQAGIPAATMADGTPNGYARLRIEDGGRYSLAWYVARDPDASGIGLHLPRVLRKGAYPAWGVYANVYMGDERTRVEYRVDGGEWKSMSKVLQADPALLAENMRDDLASELRGYDRSPEAKPSQHLWRGALPTDLPVGEHRVEVKTSDRWRGEIKTSAMYRLDAAPG